MSALGERIRFLAENPEVYVQSFNAREAQEFLVELDEMITLADNGGEWGDPGEDLRRLGRRLGVLS